MANYYKELNCDHLKVKIFRTVADSASMAKCVEYNSEVCNNCKAINKSFSRFCGNCGAKLEIKKQFKTDNPKFSSFYKKFAASFIGIGIASFLLLGISELSAVSDVNCPRWLEIKPYVSKSFRLTNTELDMLLAKIIKKAPSLSQPINVNQMISLEYLIKKRLRNREISLFPNPFFSEPDRIIKETESEGSGFVYSDIPMNHPTYIALKSLIDIGISCHTNDLKFRPYDKVTWKEWTNVIEVLMTRLNLDIPVKLSKTNKPINNYELESLFSKLRAFFALPEKETFAWASDPYYPGRLEVFAALSSMLKEFQEVR